MNGQPAPPNARGLEAFFIPSVLEGSRWLKGGSHALKRPNLQGYSWDGYNKRRVKRLSVLWRKPTLKSTR